MFVLEMYCEVARLGERGGAVRAAQPGRPVGAAVTQQVRAHGEPAPAPTRVLALRLVPRAVSGQQRARREPAPALLALPGARRVRARVVQALVRSQRRPPAEGAPARLARQRGGLVHGRMLSERAAGPERAAALLALVVALAAVRVLHVVEIGGGRRVSLAAHGARGRGGPAFAGRTGEGRRRGRRCGVWRRDRCGDIRFGDGRLGGIKFRKMCRRVENEFRTVRERGESKF